jgi:hypothetical protein
MERLVAICLNIKLATPNPAPSRARLDLGANGTCPALVAFLRVLPHQSERSIVLLLKILLTMELNALLWKFLSNAPSIIAQLTVNTLLGLISVIAPCLVEAVSKLVVALS